MINIKKKIEIKVNRIVLLCTFSAFISSVSTFHYEKNKRISDVKYKEIYKTEIKSNTNKNVSKVKKRKLSKLEVYKKLMDEVFEIEQDLETVKEFILFQEELAGAESTNRKKIVNRLGCVGLYQFCDAELSEFNLKIKDVQNMSKIKQDSMQMVKAKKDLKRISKKCKDTYKKSKGALIGGAHLGGATGVVSFFTTGKDPKDCNGDDCQGKRISDYVAKFEKYELKGLKIK